jgi:Short C-terminal domain
MILHESFAVVASTSTARFTLLMAQPLSRSFDANPARVFDALVRAITDAGFNITSSDSEVRSVSFQTGTSWKSWGGQLMTATVGELPDNESRVICGGVRRGFQYGKPGQVFDWGEKLDIASKLFDRIEELLPDVPDRGADGASPLSPAEELARLAELHNAGSLTAEEFQAAKAKVLG